MVQRKRPLKLHIKDGKDARFLLIGHRGRELKDLVWDGHDLTLAAVTADDAAPTEPDLKPDAEHSSGFQPPIETEEADSDDTTDSEGDSPEEDLTLIDMDDADANAQSETKAETEDVADATATEPLTQDELGGGITVMSDDQTPDVTGDADVEGVEDVIDDALNPDLPSPEGEPSPNDDGSGLDKTSSAKDMLEIEQDTFEEAVKENEERDEEEDKKKDKQ